MNLPRLNLLILSCMNFQKEWTILKTAESENRWNSEIFSQLDYAHSKKLRK